MVTIDEMREFLDLRSTEKDEWVKTLITASTLLIKYYTGADFTYETATSNTFDGTGDTFLPITSPLENVTAVAIDGTTQTLADFYVNGYYLENSEGTVFTEGKQNIVVTGDWGISDSGWDEDINIAQRMLISWLYKKDKDNISVENSTYKGKVTTLLQDIPLPIRIILDNHRVRIL